MAVTPSTAAVNRLKLMAVATDEPVLTDSEIQTILQDWAIADSSGSVPTGTWSEFDWNGAAETAWRIKHGRAAKLVSSSADGQQFNLSDIRAACLEQITLYQHLRQTGTVAVDGLDTY